MSEPPPLPPGEKSSLHIDPNLAGALCYLFGCLSGIIFFLLESENKRVRFHALQSVFIFAVLTVVSILSVILAIITDFLPFRLATSLIWLAHVVIWLVMVIKTYQGQTVKIPLLGDFAQEQVGWPDSPDAS